jgi:hypothetical protein
MKRQILEKFIKENSHLSEQGSKQWLEERQLIVGGSEMSVVIGKNKYSSIQSLISQKVGLTNFTGNTATRWGNLFESMTELIFKTLFLNGDPIYSTGSVPHKEIEAHRYSPDGLCIMKIDGVFRIVLLEFKAPFSSVPEKKIPPHYLPQVKAGLCTLDLTEKAVFVNNMFRKCKLSQLDFNPTYDTLFHKDSKKKLEIPEAIACGIILFHIPGQNINEFLSALLGENDANSGDDADDGDDDDGDDDISINKKHEFATSDSDYESFDADDDIDDDFNKSLLHRLHRNVSLFLNTEMDPAEYKLLDLGESGTIEMAEWLELFKPERGDSFLKAKYIKPNLNVDSLMDEYDNVYISKELDYVKKQSYLNQIHKKYNFKKTIEKYKANCLRNGLIPVAVLPWKLIKSDVIVIDKDPEFLNQHKEKINDVISKVKYIVDNASDLDARANVFGKIYPDSSIVRDYWENKPTSPEDIKDFL